MKPAHKSISIRNITIGILLTSILLVVFAVSTFAHGPKGHGGQSFTALEAAKKGITLYDKLVAGGKLEESWETGLIGIKVFPRSEANKNEFVVQFDRGQGEPRSVFIFFDEKGDYSGSNFTGE